MTLAVLLIGLVVTGGLSAVSRVSYLHSEDRQVSARAQLAAAALAVAPVDVQRRLGRAATLVAATGRVSLFAGALKGSLPVPFDGVELFEMVHGAPRLVTSLGKPTLLRPSSTPSRDLLERAGASGSLALTRVATASQQRLGYAMAETSLGRTYVAYAEQVFPGDRHVEVPASSPLATMHFAVYYGQGRSPAALMETNTDHLPIRGRTATAPIPFGDQVLTLVVSPTSSLLGAFAASVAWLVAGVGILLTAVMALLTDRLGRRRAVAERLARVADRLYRDQRGVAETLQTALLPDRLPTRPGLSVATRYLAGTEGIEVGGDWYDLITLPGNRIFFTIGDVSGRGLSAATTMSRLLHSITAYAVDGDDPATVLTKVSGLIDLERDGHFATALCGILDADSGALTVANAGHPPLVLVTEDLARPLEAPVGPPLGVGSHYDATDLVLSAGAVLLAYTDGLVERREEPIDAGIARLCRSVPATTDLEDLLAAVLTALLPHGASQDDTAILALRWTR